MQPKLQKKLRPCLDCKFFEPKIFQPKWFKIRHPKRLKFFQPTVHHSKALMDYKTDFALVHALRGLLAARRFRGCTCMQFGLPAIKTSIAPSRGHPKLLQHSNINTIRKSFYSPQVTLLQVQAAIKQLQSSNITVLKQHYYKSKPQ
jgi:hypothetical protein